MRGVKDFAIIDAALLGSVEARRLDEYASKLQETYPRVGTLRRKADSCAATRSWVGRTTLTAGGRVEPDTSVIA